MKKCLICNKKFTTEILYSSQKYCSRECRVIGKKRLNNVKNCLYCNMKFIPYRNIQKYCSDICEVAMRHRREKENRKKLKLTKPYICTNINCKKIFIPKRTDQRFCSLQCQIEYNETHKKELCLRKMKTCPICNKEFNGRRSKYCSEECIKISEKLSHKKAKQKHRRELGFNIIWEPKIKICPMDYHHIDKNNVIAIPSKLHKSITHNVHTGRNIDIINKKALEYMLESFILTS